MRKKRLVPITSKKQFNDGNKRGSTSSHATLISKVHALNKKIARASDVEEKVKLEHELDSLGGVVLYQHASRHGAKPFDASRWLVQKLVEIRKRDGISDKWDLLDVGALRWSYPEKWLHVRAIDLHAKCGNIEKCDLFDVFDPVDIVCLSLVINFAGCPKERGAMLIKSWELVRSFGFLYIVLPRPCMDNARYLDRRLWLEIVKVSGWKIVQEHSSSKLVFYLLQRLDRQWDGDLALVSRKRLVNDGHKCNNFCILLEKDYVPKRTRTESDSD